MIKNILERVGNTPIVSIKLKGFPLVNLFAKLEFYNPTGSVKDRAASFVIKKAMRSGLIKPDTTVIESSSGNFGIALAAFCQHYGLKFICVIDKNILPINETLIRAYGATVIKIDEPDKYGGYLINRIRKVKDVIKLMPNTYWVNQYESVLNADAYYNSLGNEICDDLSGEGIDYVFMSVGSGGTITGVSRKVKERYPDVKVVAVDIYGSVIFNDTPAKRYIPGIGSSIRPKILEQAIIDDIVWVNEVETVECCAELLKEQYLFSGGSSGSVYAGIKKYFSMTSVTEPVSVVCIFPDRGERYNGTVYDVGWCNRLRASTRKEVEVF